MVYESVVSGPLEVTYATKMKDKHCDEHFGFVPIFGEQ
jgi:hypothetical protein